MREKGSFKHPATENSTSEGLNDCIGKGLKEDPDLSTRKIAKP
jgi:hypothetical protein